MRVTKIQIPRIPEEEKTRITSQLLEIIEQLSVITCLGIMGLAKHYSPERLEASCARAILIKAYSYKSVNSILKNGLDQQPKS